MEKHRQGKWGYFPFVLGASPEILNFVQHAEPTKWVSEDVPGATMDSQASLASENSMRTCSVSHECTNITYMMSHGGLHTWIPSAIVPHLSLLYGRSEQNPRSSTAGGSKRLWQFRAGVPGLDREVAMPSRAGQAPLTGVQIRALSAPECLSLEGWFTECILGCSAFPPAVWSNQLTESSWLHNISLMPEEFDEPTNDAVLFDWRWYFFFIAVDVNASGM